MKKWKRKLRRVAIVTVVLFVCFQLVSWTEPLAAFWLLERAIPDVVWRIHTSAPLVALSFDDGPSSLNTPKVLAILKDHHARATFFLIGQRVIEHPEFVGDIKAAGHEVGNHYFMNGATLRHSDADFLRYLDRTEAVAGIRGPLKLFRPPGGVAWPHQLHLACERGYTCVLGSAYPHDPVRPPAWYIEWLVEKNLVPGAIVILHDGIPDPSRSIEALPHILNVAEQRGLRVVSIGELMKSSMPREASAPESQDHAR
jgi:peptidoglycan-N-acetylglucosamine deacetylase